MSRMLRSLKKISCFLLLAFGLQSSWAFSLLGPFPEFANYTPPSLPGSFGDDWEVSTIGYGYSGSGDIGGPKNLGEQYRRNAQTYYYAFDANFLDFFGSNGVYAVSSAYTIMNNCLTNVDAYSSTLTEFPLNSQSFNYQASALGLVDLQSETLGVLVELMGLANPVRFTWTLHDRYLPSGATCPAYEYLVVARNFDITASPLNQLQYSPYVNGTLYSYFIEEFCPANVPDPQAVALPLQVDPLQNAFAPVAGNQNSLVLLGDNLIDAGLQEGGFYNGLTRDDVAGLRYLLSTNLIAYESPATGSLLVSSSGPGGTNYGAPFFLTTLDLATFVLAAKTNDPVTLSNLYPGLIISSSTPVFSRQYTTNYVGYYTNLIGAPAGSQKLIIVPVVTSTFVTTYVDTFANIITNTYSPNTTAQLIVTNIAPLTGAPVGSPLQTNVTVSTVTLAGIPSGDFYINTNTCGPDLVITNLGNIPTAITNVTLVASNSAGLYYSQTLVTYSNYYGLGVLPVVCAASGGGGTTTNFPGLYRGIGHVQFVPTSYDSLVGQFYQPITNTYNQVLIVNSKPVNETFQRVVTVPDYLISASDQANGPDEPVGDQALYRGLNYNIANIATAPAGKGLAGPGTIDGLSDIIFNKAGLAYANLGPGNQSSGITLLNWASFDGSTNDPVVYPNGTSIDNVGNTITVQISPAQGSLPNGARGAAYTAVTFSATGGSFSTPFTWSAIGLPAGLTLSSGGTLSGTPTQSGIYDFTVILTDSLGRTVQWGYSITIN
jgi:hypothetical protein